MKNLIKKESSVTKEGILRFAQNDGGGTQNDGGGTQNDGGGTQNDGGGTQNNRRKPPPSLLKNLRLLAFLYIFDIKERRISLIITNNLI